MAEPRVNFAGLTAIPRENSRGEAFHSCFAPVRDHTNKNFTNLNFVVNDETEIAAVVAIGVVPLAEITTVIKPYVNQEGDELEELTTTLGNIRARGEW
jgi:hypothetical protein